MSRWAGTDLVVTRRTRGKAMKLAGGTDIKHAPGITRVTRNKALRAIRENDYPELFKCDLVPNVDVKKLSRAEKVAFKGVSASLQHPADALVTLCRQNAVSGFSNEHRWIAAAHLYKAVAAADKRLELQAGGTATVEGDDLRELGIPVTKGGKLRVQRVVAGPEEIVVEYAGPGVVMTVGADAKNMSEMRLGTQDMTVMGVRVHFGDDTAQHGEQLRLNTVVASVISKKENEPELLPHMKERFAQLDPIAKAGCVEYVINKEDIVQHLRQFWPDKPVRARLPVRLVSAGDMLMVRSVVLGTWQATANFRIWEMLAQDVAGASHVHP